MKDEVIRGQDLDRLLDRWRRDVESGRETAEWERELFQDLKRNPTHLPPQFVRKLNEWSRQIRSN